LSRARQNVCADRGAVGTHAAACLRACSRHRWGARAGGFLPWAAWWRPAPPGWGGAGVGAGAGASRGRWARARADGGWVGQGATAREQGGRRGREEMWRCDVRVRENTAEKGAPVRAHSLQPAPVAQPSQQTASQYARQAARTSASVLCRRSPKRAPRRPSDADCLCQLSYAPHRPLRRLLVGRCWRRRCHCQARPPRRRFRQPRRGRHPPRVRLRTPRRCRYRCRRSRGLPPRHLRRAKRCPRRACSRSRRPRLAHPGRSSPICAAQRDNSTETTDQIQDSSTQISGGWGVCARPLPPLTLNTRSS